MFLNVFHPVADVIEAAQVVIMEGEMREEENKTKKG
jgi:hypothetical protein